MPSWENSYNNHELWSKLSTLKEQIGEVELPEDDDARDTLEYLTAACELAASRQTGSTPLQVTSTMLTGTDTAVQTTIDNLAGWQGGTYTDGQMDSVTEALIQSLAIWPPMTTEQLATSHAAMVNQLSEATSEALQVLTKQRDELVYGLDNLSTQQTTLETKIAEQSQIITTSVAALETNSKNALDTSKTEWTEERDGQSAQAEERLQALRDLEQQAQDLVYSATGASVATDYGEYARKQTQAATICDVVAALVGAAGVTALLIHLYTAGNGADGQVGLSLTRLAASLGVLGVAVLIGQRGTQHHREARDAKRTDLAIRRVGPFTSKLGKDEQELIVIEVTDRIFVKGELGKSSPRESLVEKVRKMRSTTDTEPEA